MLGINVGVLGKPSATASLPANLSRAPTGDSTKHQLTQFKKSVFLMFVTSFL
jgi:hypothetical protein